MVTIFGGSDSDRAKVAAILKRGYPERLHNLCEQAGIKVYILADDELYREASPVLDRYGIEVDKWPIPPAGLFVVEERQVYLRSIGPMTVAHEYGHAIDCALGEGTYFSSTSIKVRRCYSKAKAFVTDYAATGLDEYFAESLRAMSGMNDNHSPWPRATRSLLRSCDPDLHKILLELFRG